MVSATTCARIQHGLWIEVSNGPGEGRQKLWHPYTFYAYRPIAKFQTRPIWLHGNRGNHDALATCHLYIADILAPDHHGLGLRARGSGQDRNVRIDALS